MDLKQLRYFAAVGEELSFVRAAARLHMSQPPLSQRIHELERELGCLLLDRSVRPMRLTEAGRILLSEAREILERADRAQARTRSAAGQRVLTIGVVSEAVAGLVAGLSCQLRDALQTQYPFISLRLRVLGITNPTAGLHTDQVDIAVTRLPFDTKGIRIRSLGHEPLVAALRSDDTLTDRAEIESGELRNRLWCHLPQDADPLWRDFWLGCLAHSPTQGREFAGPVVRSLAEYVHSVTWDGAVGIVPSSVARLFPTTGVRYVPLTDQPKSQLVLAWRESRTDKVLLDVVNTIAATVAEHASEFFKLPS